jgi:Tol biopolymer transport system component/DNA-binding winged helix-turn-helix (wHTH) protein
MILKTDNATRVSFGLYEADLRTGELWKAGIRIKLQGQPFKVLTVLLERPGDVVTREELQLRLWGKDSVGDFDHSIGTAINKIREALGDTADNPRFVETLARRGYRFIAPVSVLGVTEKTSDPLEHVIAETTAEPRLPFTGVSAKVPPPQLQRASRAWKLTAFVSICALLAMWVFDLIRKPVPPLLHIEQLTRTGRIAPGMPAMESLPAAATDGLRIFTPVIAEGRSHLSEVDVHTGVIKTLSVPSEITSPTLGDLSPDGATLLLRSHLSPESEQPFWLVPTGGGSALRLANAIGHDATWMPDSKSILYASGNELLINRLQDGTNVPFATLPGRAFWLRWSPDGQLLRFTLLDPIGHTLGLWELGRDGKSSHKVLSGWSKPSSECCGVWTGGGKYFVFQSNHGGSSTDLWRLNGNSESQPVRVTNGPLNFVGPVSPRSGERIYFLGLETQSTLLLYDATKRQFVPEQAFLASANRVDYSRDGSAVTWTDAEGRLWRANTNGTEVIQITPDSLQVFLGHWSPDGRSIALMAREPGKAWQIYIVSATGGPLDHLNTGPRNAADPTWSPDGQKIVFGRLSDVMGKEETPRALLQLDLRTHAVTTLPGSDNLFSPRWSPDGRYIAALSLDQGRLLLFDTATQHWQTIAETTAADPVWSADGKFVYFHASLAEMQPIYRVSIPDGRLEQIANLTSFLGGTTADYFFCGLTPDNSPIVRARTGTGNLYTIDLDSVP